MYSDVDGTKEHYNRVCEQGTYTMSYENWKNRFYILVSSVSKTSSLKFSSPIQAHPYVNSRDAKKIFNTYFAPITPCEITRFAGVALKDGSNFMMVAPNERKFYARVTHPGWACYLCDKKDKVYHTFICA